MTNTLQHPNLDVIINFYQFEKTVTHNIFLPSFIIIWHEIGESGGELFWKPNYLMCFTDISPADWEMEQATTTKCSRPVDPTASIMTDGRVFELGQIFLPQAN